ncbi:TRAP transporter small permease subunit [Roseovarius pelagicus]|uniref:TRAP transporter small permease protein n=1 Tax=Roseovarius pelagicus TaxID=2980108 RepID=A0ABY6DAI7_9RHOB|nr:TRAP transporter small permease [Roseovarius pelagicus]UXX83172.1 TRAP transporter small permease [Roseovarius pelagicus]
MSYLDRVLEIMRVVSLYLSRLAGFAVLLVVAMVTTEVVSRSLVGRSIGFSTEISGYILALCVTWPLAHVLHRKGHIRIDVVYTLVPQFVKALLDIFALIIVAGISYLLVNASMDLVAVTYVQGDIANTTLETPLWFPQVMWAFGFAWFGMNVAVLMLRAIIHLLAGNYDKINYLIGFEEN